jgi:hypothetical protein
VIANATANFESWRLEYGPGKDPGDNEWQTLFESQDQVTSVENVFTWDITQVPNGKYTLRLRMENQDGGYAQKSVHIELSYTPPTEVPTPIPPTETQVPPTAIPTEMPSATPEPPTAVPPTEIPSTETPTATLVVNP